MCVHAYAYRAYVLACMRAQVTVPFTGVGMGAHEELLAVGHRIFLVL